MHACVRVFKNNSIFVTSGLQGAWRHKPAELELCPGNKRWVGEGAAGPPPGVLAPSGNTPSLVVHNTSCTLESPAFSHISGPEKKPVSSVQSRLTLRPHGLQYTKSPFSNSQSLLKLMSIESVMPFSHLVLCRPLLLLPSIFLSIRVFSSESNEKKLVGSWQFHRIYPGHLCTYRLAQ